jgi:hypothetical protein
MLCSALVAVMPRILARGTFRLLVNSRLQPPASSAIMSGRRRQARDLRRRLPAVLPR